MVKGNTPPGPGVDASGQAVIDPTANVIAILTAAVDRQDDLRDLGFSCIREVQALQREFDKERREFAHEIRAAESARIDAIRTVDVAAVQRAAEVAAEAVQTLAAQVPITAEAVRTSLAAALGPILNDIGELRKVQYEQQGQKAAGDDPMVRALAEFRQFMIETQTQKDVAVEQKGSNQWGIGLAVIGFLSFASIMTSVVVLIIHG